jgi:hypothetical protein
MNSFVRTLLLLLAALLAPGLAPAADSKAPLLATATGPGHLSVSGADILGPDGRPIFLRGWNWGHWGKAQEADAADNARQGANVVRIPLRWWGYYQGPEIDARNEGASTTAGIDPAHLKMLDDYVAWASRAHLWIILFIDSNCGQNGLQNAKMVAYCDPQGQFRDGHNFFNDPAARARFVEVWRFIANRYKDTPYLGLFEPLPEPGAPGTSPKDINAFYEQLIPAIRQVAPGIPFLVGAHTYKATRIAEVYHPEWKDVVYTGNLFLHSKRGPEAGVAGTRSRMQTILALRSQYRVPVFVQQVGTKSGEDPDAGQLRQVLGGLVENRIGFTYWEYRGSANPDEYSALYQKSKSEWAIKPGVMNAVSDALKR